MKIVDAKVIVCSPGRNFVTLKIVTEDGIYGLGDATLNGRELAVASYLADGLESIGWRVATRPVASAIVGATPPGVERTLLQWHRHLEENGVVCAPREGLLRFSPHFYNDEDEVMRIVALLR